MNRFLKRALEILCGLTLMVISVAFFIVTWPSSQPPPTTEVVLLRDVTDTTVAQPDDTAVLKLYGMSDAERWNGSVFRFASITDVGYNGLVTARVEPANKWLSNELQRDKEIKRFREQVTGAITEGKHDARGRPYSSVYAGVARQLISLSESKAEQRVLIVFSDLMENTPLISFYDDRMVAVLRDRPDEIVRAWEATEKLPTLAGIVVYLIYQPKDADDDARFEVVSAFYKRLLESKGAVVHIAATLTN